jgi:hypothetical protein
MCQRRFKEEQMKMEQGLMEENNASLVSDWTHLLNRFIHALRV